MSEIYLVAD